MHWIPQDIRRKSFCSLKVLAQSEVDEAESEPSRMHLSIFLVFENQRSKGFEFHQQRTAAHDLGSQYQTLQKHACRAPAQASRGRLLPCVLDELSFSTPENSTSPLSRILRLRGSTSPLSRTLRLLASSKSTECCSIVFTDLASRCEPYINN